MVYTQSFSRRAFLAFNYIVITAAGLLCLFPFINLIAVSLSGSAPVAAGAVGFWPKQFTLGSYKFVIRNAAFIRSFLVSIERVILGVLINMLLIVMTAYPLSKEEGVLKKRGAYVWFFIITMLFGGGMIPWYMVIRYTHLLDTIWALVIPGALPVFNMVIMMNFFRGLPKELEEAAYIDGASHWVVLWKIFIPLSKPSLATVGLFCIVNHWNSWFDGLLLMNRPEHYPLQSYLQTIIVNPEAFFKSMAANPDIAALTSMLNNQTTKAAQLIIAAVPVLIAYPFLQKHFTTGLVMGSVKG
jgi:putative aldouronate transport system permease protein